MDCFRNGYLLTDNEIRQCKSSEKELELMPGRLVVYKILLCALMCGVFLPRLTKWWNDTAIGVKTGRDVC